MKVAPAGTAELNLRPIRLFAHVEFDVWWWILGEEARDSTRTLFLVALSI